ncbi:MAG: hypothetical protein PHV06_11370, partial [bacterium]|nr:hypothetical protein [bacterium]
IVSVLGAYFVGKEIWDDIERMLIKLSKNLPVKFMEQIYSYILERDTTLTKYSNFAKKQRYGKAPFLPSEIEVIEQSNSKTVRLFFSRADIKSVKDSSVHILSINVDKEKLKKFEDGGSLFGIKLSMNKNFLFFRYSLELFQSLDANKSGAIDKKGQWIDRGIFYRKTLSIGRIKFYLSSGMIQDKCMICSRETEDE